jgi:hypothetical protein
MTSACSGVVVLLLSALLLAPVPIIHILPALVIALISLAYLEEDGVLLSIAILRAIPIASSSKLLEVKATKVAA